MDTYTFATSRQIDFPVCIKINNLDGRQKQVPQSVLLRHPEIRHIGSVQNPNSELYVTAQLWAESKPLGVPMQTPYKSFKNGRIWNEWLELPVLIKDCPITSQVAITIWDLSPFPENDSLDHAVPFGGTTVPLFDKDGTLQRGRQKCKVYRKRSADGETPSTTLYVPAPKRRKRNEVVVGPSPVEEEIERLEKLFKKHEMNELPRNDWLDKLVFQVVREKSREADDAARKRAIIRRGMRRKTRSEKRSAEQDGAVFDEESTSDSNSDDEELFTLLVEFPRWDFPIVFEDHEYKPSKMMREFQNTPTASGVQLKPPPPEVRYGPGIAGANAAEDEEEYPLIQIFDPEQFQRENPCETKHRRLVRSDRNAYVDRDQKPNAKLRDELNEILAYGPTQELNAQEKDVVWTFRHHLSKEKRALTKVLKATDWNTPGEARQAIKLIPKWAEIDVDAALELLGPTYDNPVVRAYAVDRLRKADDAELLLYLLQLVQALKFEKPVEDEEGLTESSLARFLIDRAAHNFLLGNYLHWYLMVECDDRGPDTNAAHRKLFARVEYYFMLELEKRDPEQRKILRRQGELIAVLSKISKDIRFGRDNRMYKIDRLKKYLGDANNELIKIHPPLPLPLDPLVQVTGVFAEDASVFKSSLSPLLINFKITNTSPESSATSLKSQSKSSSQSKYPIIFKTGDDLRQDQLVIQIITLMNNLLLKENLDLKLTPYHILATSPQAGAVQFIPSMPLSAISQKYRGSVLTYLRSNNPDTSGPLGVRKETMDTYVKSCAGYCVITYILGVGDRHLDNLLISPSGNFFHIDFGFILGRDPKPFAPLIKICKEMVEGLGGTNSSQYAQFRQYCFTAYTTLRKSSSLVLNLFSLMVQSSVPDLRMVEEQMGGVGGAVAKVRERFNLDVSEEEAVRLLDQVIGDSVNAVFGVVIDKLHDFVQGWRA